MAAATGLSRGAAWALALTATLTMAVSYVDRQTLAVLAPTVTRELQISEQGYGLLISAFSFSYIVASPLAGRLLDRIGARWGLVGAVLLWSLVAASHALAPSFSALFALRLALGVAEAPSFPGASQTVQRALPPADRVRGFGVLFNGSSIGTILASQMAPVLEKHWGFRAAFLWTAAIGFLWLPIWYLVAFHPAARQALDRPESGPSQPVLPHALGPYRSENEPSQPGQEARPADRGVLQGAPSWRETVTNVAVLRSVAMLFCYCPLMMLLFNWESKYLVQVHGLTQSEVGPYLMIPLLFFDLGALAFGHFGSQRAKRLQDGSSPRALFALAAACCAFPLALPLARGPVEAVVLLTFCGTGGGGLAVLITSDMLRRVHPNAVATASGCMTATQSLANIIASLSIGIVLQRGVSYGAVGTALATMVFPGAVVWLLWKPPPPYQEQEPASEDAVNNAA